MKYKIEPWEHQRTAIEIASDRPDGYALFFEMGTGKTCTSINILRAKCYEEGRLLRTLVLCPPVVRENWRREFSAHSTIKSSNISVLEGPGAKRLALFNTKAYQDEHRLGWNPHIFITNYEALQMKDLFAAIKYWNPEVLIFDESHRLKNYKAKRTKLAIELSDKASYKMLLTGTPILNTPMDIWSQYRILDGGRTFDKNFFAFRARYFRDKNAGMPQGKYFPNWQPLEGLAETFNEAIYKKASRVKKSECLDLPPLVRKRINVSLDAEQYRMYLQMEKAFVAYLDDKACVATIALTKILRLQQMLCGFFIDDEENVHKFARNPRLEATKDVLEQITGDHKVIIWATFRDNYSDLISLCDGMGISYTTLYGGMSDKQRQESIDSFQNDPSVRAIISNQAAGGTGVNLTAASYSLYYSRSYNLEHDLQSEARNHRGGSEVHDNITRVDIVAPGTIDEIILDALARKENLANNILKVRELL